MSETTKVEGLSDLIATRGGLAADRVDALRAAMGTLPSMKPEKRTRFFRGVEGIDVSLLDWPRHPYRAIFGMVTATWGNAWAVRKWETVTPEARFFAVKACLEGRALPNGQEASTFVFEVAGVSRAAFDQIARVRIGAVIGSMGVRDNNHADADFRVPDAMWTTDLAERNGAAYVRPEIKDALLTAKDAYVDYLDRGEGHWQDARALMPMSMLHRFTIAINYAALRGLMGKRLQACEQADTVAAAWLMRLRVEEKFPLLAAYLRPSCDAAKSCTYHSGHALSEAFGCLFKGCGRWPESDDGYATFNESCSDYPTMARQAGFMVFPGDAILAPARYEDLSAIDREAFEA